MSVKPVTFYQVACDEPDCPVYTGSGFSEYAAWSDRADALEDWENRDGIALKDGRTFCADHRDAFTCNGCDWLVDDCQCEPAEDAS